jgi:hypothetical protein
MKKTEILKQSAEHANVQRIEHLASQIDALSFSKQQSAEALAATLEPLAQAMAALTDETRKTLADIQAESVRQGQEFKTLMDNTTHSWRVAAQESQSAAQNLQRAGNSLTLTHYMLTTAVGMLSATLVIALWLWLAPRPRVEVDTQALAQALKEDMIVHLKPLKNRSKR